MWFARMICQKSYLGVIIHLAETTVQTTDGTTTRLFTMDDSEMVGGPEKCQMMKLVLQKTLACLQGRAHIV
eukprot:277963-Amphidinium_carterae.1